MWIRHHPAHVETNRHKCHISHVVADTDSWEQKLAQTLEEMPEVVCYVKNHNLGFAIPYTIDGEEKNYIPDFIVRFQGADGELINLIIEVTGEKKKEKLAKVATAKNLWVPAVNNHGGLREVGLCGNYRPLGRPEPYPGLYGSLPNRPTLKPLGFRR